MPREQFGDLVGWCGTTKKVALAEITTYGDKLVELAGVPDTLGDDDEV